MTFYQLGIVIQKRKIQQRNYLKKKINELLFFSILFSFLLFFKFLILIRYRTFLKIYNVYNKKNLIENTEILFWKKIYKILFKSKSKSNSRIYK